ncbi:DUF2867 domain-containing protein [Paracoccus jiaweipingae]|uniref:DUF2867 domain-containing protein n=1 Tax=unclassified Paracoccus (in: a-proteobacteria) TaxID=2688777 RepID=UPI0037ABA51F
MRQQQRYGASTAPAASDLPAARRHFRRFRGQADRRFQRSPREYVQAGDRLDFFLVDYRDGNSPVLTGRDRHPDVMTCMSTQADRVAITSSVQVHHRFRRRYMLPVGIAHRLLVGNVLRRFASGLARPASRQGASQTRPAIACRALMRQHFLNHLLRA